MINLMRCFCFLVSFLPLQGLLKMDCQGLVAKLVMDFVLLTTAVEVAGRWRELAEKLIKVSRQQMDAYEAPHRDVNGVVDSEVCLSESLPVFMSFLCFYSDYTGLKLYRPVRFLPVIPSKATYCCAMNMSMCDLVV